MQRRQYPSPECRDTSQPTEGPADWARARSATCRYCATFDESPWCEVGYYPVSQMYLVRQCVARPGHKPMLAEPSTQFPSVFLRDASLSQDRTDLAETTRVLTRRIGRYNVSQLAEPQEIRKILTMPSRSCSVSCVT